LRSCIGRAAVPDKKSSPERRLQNSLVTPTGLEAISPSVDADRGLRQVPPSRAAKSGALDAGATKDIGLSAIVSAWPDLPERARRRILALLKNYGY
jgi:hypothetical protein